MDKQSQLEKPFQKKKKSIRETVTYNIVWTPHKNEKDIIYDILLKM